MAKQAPGARGLLAEKRQAIIRAAQEVFLREGFSRASVDAIAATAGVSKRTIYNHYASKEELFLTVIEEAVAPVITQFTQLANEHLGTITDLESDLTAFCRDWVRLTVLFPEHAALLRLVIAESTHFPWLAEAWRGAGPGPSHRALASHLSRIASQGLLRIPDPGEAARHLTALVTHPPQSRSFFGTLPVADAAIHQLVASAGRAFLRIYRPGCTAPAPASSASL